MTTTARTPTAGPTARTITTLLVANRGEIARRVFRTARALGLTTVAVYSEPDADAPFVREADLAVALGGTTSAESYLDVAKVLGAARRAGADAVHPGYGFLAENAEFAAAVVAAGLVWVGPSPEAIRAMGSKVGAKRLVAAAGVPLAPSAELTGEDPESWRAAASEVGFPLLVKASAGGGGKGMRLVSGPDDVAEAVAAARREAGSSFGDPTVFLERYLAGARHVEVQVFGDAHGSVVHLLERECSIQRRHQKIVEETPSPGTTAATRAAMCAAAVAAARAVGYVGAGTVEFLVAGEGAGQEFFFLEMNTRLQVEHPVTEAVTGLDLVALQLLVAGGEPLPFAQSDVTASGHAIEARLYAEDPAAGFLPSTGPVLALDAVDGVRWDSGVETGSVVTAHYDPMLAKVVAHGRDRAEAAHRLARALRAARLHGPTTNRDSLVAILESAPFLAGATPTDFLDRHPALLAPAVPEEVRTAHLVAATLHAAAVRRTAAPVLGFAPSGWRNVDAVPQSVGYDLAGQPVEVEYRVRGTAGGSAEVHVDGVAHAVRVHRIDGDVVDLDVDGLRRRVRVATYGERVCVDGGGWSSDLVTRPRFAHQTGESDAGGPAAPVPGTVTLVAVAAGDRVAEGQTLVVLEAMKMEHRITAEEPGRVAAVLVAVGDSVDAHQVLVVIEGAGDE